MIPFVDFKAQLRPLEKEIQAAIRRVLKSGWFILGEELRAFEEEFAAYVGTQYAVGVNSGTDAIHLALLAVGVKPGKEVVTVANTCVPTICAIAATGARIVLADIEPETLTMDPASLESKITSKTAAIVPVHLYGHPCNMEEICEIARQRNIPVVEDCAQAHGTLWQGRKCGTFGHAGAFSFYPTKNLGAYGDAGAVVTNDPDVAAFLRKLRNYGEEKRYTHVTQGFNSRLDEIQAAILRVKLKYLDEWNVARRIRADWYRQGLRSRSVEKPVEHGEAYCIYHLYVIRSPYRDALQSHLHDHGISTLIHYPIPVHLQPAYRKLGYREGDFPNAEKACKEVLSLPMYPELKKSAINTICSAINTFDP
ncbi:MAG TPA: DegT/DnrJ/EryC1/StrS family aminotransferase [Candidatus Hydrogenedentes bacterium]|nr:DegT/DnrJ/EryC1/StrS family aminotransferase [Candidatus Hydrogenedentota bacterium]HOL75540.1 DegT/DnrJ/EryC1/StrS family aminotransferase [Candidatus Hydrogenedentota bacterium]HPO86018.1 DegT/DnrJ/EryC1/StrS family aminotransferase [Candidatus Hydrogenedentota bacterium]